MDKKHNNPNVKFLCENVNNNKSDLDIIDKILNVERVCIDSGLFSAQNRIRNYWTNIDFQQPTSHNKLVIKDILDKEVEEKYFYNKQFEYYGNDKRLCARLDVSGHDYNKRVYSINFKSPTLTACRGGNRHVKIYVNGKVRRLTPNEYRKLQTIPDWYKMNVADTHVYNMCGDGWTIDVIKYILRYMI